MPLTMDEKSAISTIDLWFQQHCDGTWEHQLGIKIESTDNPGWLLTFDELKLTEEFLADNIGELLKSYRAQISTDGTMVRVFAPSLQQVLVAAACLVQKSK